MEEELEAIRRFSIWSHNCVFELDNFYDCVEETVEAVRRSNANDVTSCDERLHNLYTSLSESYDRYHGLQGAVQGHDAGNPDEQPELIHLETWGDPHKLLHVIHFANAENLSEVAFYGRVFVSAHEAVGECIFDVLALYECFWGPDAVSIQGNRI